MPVEQTFSIIKPNAVAKNAVGEIYRRFEAAGLKIIASKMLYLSARQAEDFYAEHQGKPFFERLIKFMTSGPIFVQVLEGENAVQVNRELMGPTDHTQANPGTIRADFADNITENAVHGSDAPESASREIAYFFSSYEVFSNKTR